METTNQIEKALEKKVNAEIEEIVELIAKLDLI